MASHFGGDEFILIISYGEQDRNFCLENTKQIADKLLATLDTSISCKQASLQCWRAHWKTGWTGTLVTQAWSSKKLIMPCTMAKQDETKNIAFSQTWT